MSSSLYSWDAVLRGVTRLLSVASNTNIETNELSAPPNPELGDLAFGCFKLAKQQGKSPADIAKQIAADLTKSVAPGEDIVETAVAAGPYVNITLNTGALVLRVVKDIETRPDFGVVEDGKGHELMLEYAQPNTHKEIHVGHFRNLVLGASLVNLLRMAGWKVTAASYHGDVGAHVAKCLWLFVRKGAAQVKQVARKRKKGDPPFVPMSDDAWAAAQVKDLTTTAVAAMIKVVPRDQQTGKYLGSLYSESTKVLEENPDWKTEVSDVQRHLEAGEPAWTQLWQETRRWSVIEMERIFQEVGVKIDRRYLESEVVEAGQKIVDELLAAGVARESQGAIIVDLEEQKLGVFLVRKSDGTSLYATKDLALAKLKIKEFSHLERSLILVDNRQQLYFKQLFATLKLIGLSQSFEFVGYEFVTLKSGAMSSRDGNIVTLQDFCNEVLAFATTETESRHTDWSEGRISHTAWCLMIGGTKFGMLRQDSDKQYIFDIQQAMAFDGATGPYVQYAATRLASILRKAGWKPTEDMGADGLASLKEPSEKRLVLTLAQFPSIISRSASELRPAFLAQWCLDLATRANEFYHDVNVLESPAGTKEARLRLVSATRMVLERGLEVLGIPVPEEM
ncbi:MAG: arginine--tRNA ligase [Patescibacteria group bacterium]